MRYPWIVSPEKFARETGFVYAYDSRTAFVAFAKAVREANG